MLTRNSLVIISGGQTGADQGGLLAARELSIMTAGFVPKGFRTETGNCPWLAEYGLIETSSSDYGARTVCNVRMSDCVLLFGDISSPGTKLTRSHALHYNKLVLPENTVENMVAFLSTALKGKTRYNIMVAGNRESVNPGIGLHVYKHMVKVLTQLCA